MFSGFWILGNSRLSHIIILTVSDLASSFVFWSIYSLWRSWIDKIKDNGFKKNLFFILVPPTITWTRHAASSNAVQHIHSHRWCTNSKQWSWVAPLQKKHPYFFDYIIIFHEFWPKLSHHLTSNNARE